MDHRLTRAVLTQEGPRERNVAARNVAARNVAARITAALVWGGLVLGAGAPARAQPATLRIEKMRLGPGETEVFWLHRSPAAIERLDTNPRMSRFHLTTQADAALAEVPTWLKAAVFDQLGQLSDAVQDGLADVILRAADEDPRYVDEVAFQVARIAREVLDPGDGDGEPLDPELLLENVRGIYAAADRLDYVEILEEGGGVTTLRYRIRDGASDHFWDLPYEDYYWYVVHPRTGYDYEGYVDPRDGKPSPRASGGRFWRSYLSDPAPDPDYAREISLKLPVAIPDGELSGWGPSARGWLESVDVDPIVVAARSSDEHPVWIRFSDHPASTGGGDNGTVIATTLEVERAQAAGTSSLLVNLLHQGDGVVDMIPGRAGNRMLVIKDRDPFGAATVEDVLTQEGYDYQVMDSTGFAALATWEDLEALGVEKVVVPSDQPRRLYERLAAGRSVVEEWVGRAGASGDRIFELHGAVASTHSGDEWSDLILPGGIVGHALGEGSDTVEVHGYPRPMAVLAGTRTAWDGQAYDGLDGDRPLDPDTFALDKIGYLVSQNLDDRLGELPEDWAGPDGDCAHCVLRTEEAERVIYGHYGNCGENAHLWTAIGRMGLLPVMEVGSMAEDHVWNEILLNDRWLPCQTDWSDGSTRIDHPGNAYDKQHGGSKDLSVVTGIRGDGLLLDRTARYSDTVTFVLDITDAEGHPADGARVVVANENYYDSSQLTLATVEFADVDGHLEFEAGEHQNYYVQVTHPSGGAWPDTDHVTLVACAEPGAPISGGGTCDAATPTTDATGTTIPLQIALEGPSIEDLPVTTRDASATSLSQFRLRVSFGLSVRALYGSTSEAAPRTHVRFGSPEQDGVDLYLLDLENLEHYQAGEPFEADASWLDVLGLDGDIPLPEHGGEWFLMISNARRGSTGYHYALEMTLTPPPDATDVPPPGDKNPGCGCQDAGGDTLSATALATVATLAMLLLLGWVRRRRA